MAKMMLLLIGAAFVVSLVALTAAQLVDMEQGEPVSSSSSGGPTEEPTRTSSKGELFAENASRDEPGRLDTGGDRQDSEWKETWIKASIRGVHYNLNQPAKAVDSSADNWTQVFHLDAPWRNEDKLYFCGPEPEFIIKIWDGETDGLVYDDKITTVPPCN